jgi:hypothetical protein
VSQGPREPTPVSINPELLELQHRKRLERNNQREAEARRWIDALHEQVRRVLRDEGLPDAVPHRRVPPDLVPDEEAGET